MAAQTERESAIRYAQRDASANLEELFSAVERIHPEPSAALGHPDEYAQLKDAARVWLHRFTIDQRISAIDFARIVYLYLGAVGDGHTSLDLHWKHRKGFPWMGSQPRPPFVLDVALGTFVLAAGYGALADHVGEPIIAVNDRPPELFLRPAFLAIPAETSGFRDRIFVRSQGFFYDLTGMLTGHEEFVVRFRDGTEVREPVVDYRTFQGLMVDTWVREAGQTHTALSEVAEGVILFRYDSCDASPEGMQQIEDAFRLAVDRTAQTLIIDLRSNGGGSSLASQKVMSHFADRPYRFSRSVTTRWSQDLLARRSNPEELPEQGVLTTVEREYVDARSDPFYSGTVHLLIGPGTYSAAVEIAAAVKYYRLGSIWGEETGGAVSSFGARIPIRLSRTGWAGGVSTRMIYGPEVAEGMSLSEELRRGIRPDYPARGEKLAPFMEEPDPLLAWVVDELSAQ